MVIEDHLFDYLLFSSISQDVSLQELRSQIQNCEKCYYSPNLNWRFPDDRAGMAWDKGVEDRLLELCHPNKVLVCRNLPKMLPSFHSFVSTRDNGFRFYGHVLTYFDKIVCADTDQLINQDDNVYKQNCMWLISRLPYIYTSEKVLRTLHGLFTSKRAPSLPIDSFIYNLLFEVAIPPPGQSLALKWDDADAIIIQQPFTSELPLLDIHLSAIFEHLGSPENVLKLLTSAFLEHQILLVSEDCHKLILVAEAIISLMFPFQWSHVYVPVLPFQEDSEFLDAPYPYIMGIPLRSSDEKLDRIESVFDQCFVNIDNGTVRCPEDQPSFPDQESLLRHLTRIYKDSQISSGVKKLESLIEEVESEDGQAQSPTMHRRYAKKIRSHVKSQKDKDIVAEDLRNLHAVVSDASDLTSLKSSDKDIAQDLFNVRVREMLFGSLVSLFSQYDKFVILPEIADMEGRESLVDKKDSQIFDKASFLSDQREAHLMFLSQFLETQAFASLIDTYRYIQSHSDRKGAFPALSLLNNRIKSAKEKPNYDKPTNPRLKIGNDQGTDLVRSVSIISAGRSAKQSVDAWIKTSESSLKKRHTNVDGRYPVVKLHSDSEAISENFDDTNSRFPYITNPSVLSKSVGGHDRRPDEPLIIEHPKVKRMPSVTEANEEIIADRHWKALGRLLEDVKSKTNRLVVCKLDQDTYKHGHAHISLHDLEENTLIGSLCDLLERIWCHGLNSNQKKSKSALWSHLVRYQEDSIRIMGTPMALFAPNVTAVDVLKHSAVSASASPTNVAGDEQDRQDRFTIPPIACDLLGNIKRIQNLSEVKTDIGKCRAWIRLALEQKQLHAHLKKLLSNRPLLQIIYKRYSLLRCNDEREQFLLLLLALNTVDFCCFSNSFTKTVIPYRVWIFPKKQLSGISQTSANVKIRISGNLARTDGIPVPKNCNDFWFIHQNLGVLTSTLLSHDDSGLLPRWHVDHVIVRNELSGQAYYFPCGRWIGRTVEDGSSQRLLVAQTVPLDVDLNEFLHRVNSGLVSSTQPIPKNVTVDDLRDLIGQSVNEIMQHLSKNSHSLSCAGVLTSLLLKPNGLVPLLSVLFQNGLKSSGFFRKRYLAWDVIQASCEIMAGKEKVKAEDSSYGSALASFVHDTPNSSPRRSVDAARPGAIGNRGNARHEGDIHTESEKKASIPETWSPIESLARTFSEINSKSGLGLGKEDMFQLFVCAGLKSKLIAEWLQLISASFPRESSLYEKNAHLFDTDAIRSISGSLRSLNDTPINFEQILWRGLDNLH